MNASPNEVIAVVLAGGFGTRIRSVLGDLPKPMAPVNGRPFVEWVLRYLSRQGIRRAVLATGYRAEVVESHFDSQPVPSVKVSCVAETTAMGTAGGFLNAIRHTTDSPAGWLVINGDSLALASLESLMRSLKEPGPAGSLLGVRMSDAARYGTLLCDHQGHLKSFLEKRPGRGVINAGVYLLQPSTIQRFPTHTPLSFEVDVFPALIEKGLRMDVCVEDAPFLDIGVPESLAQAGDFIQQNMNAFVRETSENR